MNGLTAASLFGVKGWVAVVTGGGTGLGLMTAKALAANGVKVYITGRRLEKLKDAEAISFPDGGSISGIQMDCTDKSSIISGVKLITSKEKHLNLLVNNAGVTSVNYGPTGAPKGDIHSISTQMFENQGFEDWTSVYSINVASYFFTSAAFLPLLSAARDHGFPEAGSILNISSISGITKDSQNGQFSYNASKAACISLTEQLATEFKRPGIEIRVNSLAPGYFPSEMTPIGDDGEKGKEGIREKWGIPMGRAGEMRDYAQAVLGLVTNRYISGSTLVVDGGWLLAHP